MDLDERQGWLSLSSTAAAACEKCKMNIFRKFIFLLSKLFCKLLFTKKGEGVKKIDNTFKNNMVLYTSARNCYKIIKFVLQKGNFN